MYLCLSFQIFQSKGTILKFKEYLYKVKITKSDYLHTLYNLYNIYYPIGVQTC